MVEGGASRTEDTRADGIPTAVTFLVGGGLCVFAPGYFDAAGWRETAWHVAGVVSATIGAVGLLSELTRTKPGEKLSDFGVGLFMFALAFIVALALVRWSPPSPLSGLLRSAVAFSIWFGIYGCVSGMTKSIRRLSASERVRPSRGETVTAVAVGLLGLLTAAVNLYAAFEAVSKP